LVLHMNSIMMRNRTAATKPAATGLETDKMMKNMDKIDLLDAMFILKRQHKELKEHIQMNEPEVHKLRKKVSKLEDEKATLALEFMNQLAAFAFEADPDGARLKFEQELKNSSQQNVLLRGTVQQLEDQLHDFRKCHISETAQSRDDFNVRLKDMQVQLCDTQSEKTSLLEEVSDLRVQLDREGQQSESLRSKVKATDARHMVVLSQLEQNQKSKEAMECNFQEELGELNDSLITMETQNASFIDDITRYQKQLEAQSDKCAEYKSECAEYKIEFSVAGDDVTRYKKQLQEQSDKCAEYQRELGVAGDDITRYRQQLEAQTDKCAEYKQKLRVAGERHVQNIARLSKNKTSSGNDEPEDRIVCDEPTQNHKELTDMTALAAEQKTEIESLMAQQEMYEERATQIMMKKITEVDGLRDQNAILYKEMNDLVDKLGAQKKRYEKLEYDLKVLKKEARSSLLPVAEAIIVPQSPKHHGDVDVFGEKENQCIEVDQARDSMEKLKRQYMLVTELRAEISVLTSLKAERKQTLSNETEDENQSLLSRLAEKYDEAAVLETKLKNKSDIMDELRAEIDVWKALKNENAEGEASQASLLSSQLEQMTNEMNAERRLVEDLRAEIVRIEGEKTVNGMDRNELDGQITSLRVALTTAQIANVENETSHAKQLRNYEQSIERMETEIDEDLTKKDNEIEELKIALFDNEGKITNLQKESRQLCESMNKMSSSRKEDMDELQAELINKTRESSKMSREIQSLEMKLGGETKETCTEAEYYKKKVRELEADKNRRSSHIFMNKSALKEIQGENMKLRESLKRNNAERHMLREKLVSAKNADKADRTPPHSVQRLKQKNVLLRKEVGRLQQRFVVI